jgi:hypothetical protein
MTIVARGFLEPPYAAFCGASSPVTQRVLRRLCQRSRAFNPFPLARRMHRFS